MTSLARTTMSSPIGLLTLVANDRALVPDGDWTGRKERIGRGRPTTPGGQVVVRRASPRFTVTPVRLFDVGLERFGHPRHEVPDAPFVRRVITQKGRDQ